MTIQKINDLEITSRLTMRGPTASPILIMSCFLCGAPGQGAPFERVLLSCHHGNIDFPIKL